jgi:glyoxylase-like metal-dependent hydrolase (beta-lactamase superfamily II)
MFERIAVPTPFQVGAVNAYLAGRTLVDPGPDSETAWERLTEGLAEAGLDPADLRQVLVTHPHPDHFGLAGRLAEAGAEVVTSPAAAPIVEDFAGRLSYEREFFADFLVRHGMNDQSVETALELAAVFLEFAPPVEVDRRVTDGDRIDVAGRSVTVRAAEGHAVGEVVFVADGTAVVGDQVLADITPNPLLQPPPDPGAERPSMVTKLNRSLRRLREADYDRLLPGHRTTIDAPTERIDAVLAAHEERSERVRETVDGPTRAVDVSKALFGDLPATEQFPGMSEAVGHLDRLEERGEVRRIEDGETVRYERVEG